jgi:hypothetical protein
MTIRKPCSHLVLAVLAALPLASLADPPATEAMRTTVSIDCDHRFLSQADAARVLGTANFSQTYAKRQSLYANVARRCQSGASQVLLVVEDPQPRAARTIATR